MTVYPDGHQTVKCDACGRIQGRAITDEVWYELSTFDPFWLENLGEPAKHYCSERCLTKALPTANPSS